MADECGHAWCARHDSRQVAVILINELTGCFSKALKSATTSSIVLAGAGVLGLVVPVRAQPAASAPSQAYQPIRPAERVEWIVEGTFGLQSLGVGIIAGGFQTGLNVPEEWGRSWSGFGKRYLQREADVAISSSIEAGLGSLWGEEPRYIRSGRRGIWSRARYALKTVLLAQRRDGHLAPAWGRCASNIFNNVIENTWLPPSATTWGATTIRSVNGFAGRAAGNLWEEFWPDIRRIAFKH